jgi:hypothetical protein
MLLALVLSSALLPAPIQDWLDRQHPGWLLAPVNSQIESWFRASAFPYAPNIVTGDFDGDGRTDYAVHIFTGREVRLIAFRATASGYAPQLLATHPPDPFTFLILYRKGEKDFDFIAGKPFRYAHDSIGLLYDNRTARTFQWDGHRFAGRDAPGDE